jgi:hypothetical protein
MADEQGRFLFRDVSPGAYSLMASQLGYVAGEYGKHWPSGSGDIFSQVRRTLEVADGEQIRDVTIRMWRRGEISGRVLDERGDPVVGMKVIGLTVTSAAGRRVYSFDTAECGGAPCLTSTTDDRGMYRLSVIPGEYVVALPAVTATRLLPAASDAAGRVPEPPSDRTSTISTLAWTGGSSGASSAGILVGDARFALSVGSATSPGIASLTDAGELFVYESQFLRGARRLAEAAIIAVGSGEEIANADFVLRPVRATRMSGVLTGPDGPAGGIALRLVPGGQDVLLQEADNAITMSDADGRFTFLGVAPGPYVIRVLNRPRQSANLALLSNPAARPPASPPLQWAGTPVTVGETPLDGVSVTLRTAARVSGRVVFDGAAPRPERLSSIQIDGAHGRDDQTVAWARVRSDSTFESDGHLPGRYYVRTTAPPGWTLVSAMWNSRDLSDVPVDLDADDVTGVVVTFTDRPAGAIAVVATTPDGQPASSAMVIVFPADRARWIDFGEQPRRLRAAGTDRRGRVVVSDLPDGEYLVAAVPGETPIHWRDAAALAELAPLAARVRLAGGGTQTATLTVRPR